MKLTLVSFLATFSAITANAAVTLPYVYSQSVFPLSSHNFKTIPPKAPFNFYPSSPPFLLFPKNR